MCVRYAGHKETNNNQSYKIFFIHIEYNSMKFYTGQGDKGESIVLSSTGKISKTDAIFEALGALDELNSYLGVCRTLAKEEEIKKLEQTIDEFGGFVGQITKFTIPGGNQLSARLDFARAMARLTERRAWTAKEKLNPAALAYLNRLSSLLFVLARYVNKKTNAPEDHPSYK